MLQNTIEVYKYKIKIFRLFPYPGLLRNIFKIITQIQRKRIAGNHSRFIRGMVYANNTMSNIFHQRIVLGTTLKTKNKKEKTYIDSYLKQK